MTEKKYIDRVVSKLQCSRAKKAEIRKELESDIHSALEQGEEIGEILSRMGDPGSIAAEFNSSFSDRERKFAKQRRRLYIFLSVLVVLAVLILLLIWWFPKGNEIGTSGIYQEQDVIEHTMKIISYWDADDMESICQESNDKMRTAITPQTLEKIKTSFSADWGECKGFGQPYIVEITQMGKTIVTIQINVSYEHTGVVYTITFDENMELAGFYVR